MSYCLKKDKAQEIKAKYKASYLVQGIGISKSYISLMLNGKKNCPKRIAYCVVKFLDNDAEIEDYFDYVD